MNDPYLSGQRIYGRAYGRKGGKFQRRFHSPCNSHKSSWASTVSISCSQCPNQKLMQHRQRPQLTTYVTASPSSLQCLSSPLSVRQSSDLKSPSEACICVHSALGPSLQILTRSSTARSPMFDKLHGPRALQSIAS